MSTATDEQKRRATHQLDRPGQAPPYMISQNGTTNQMSAVFGLHSSAVVHTKQKKKKVTNQLGLPSKLAAPCKIHRDEPKLDHKLISDEAAALTAPYGYSYGGDSHKSKPVSACSKPKRVNGVAMHKSLLKQKKREADAMKATGRCSNMECTEEHATLLCSRCKKAYYCNAECQKKNYPLHSVACKKK